eukprot:635501-Rhodomonas_salina.5
MNQNEGLADRDNAAALSWLMQVASPCDDALALQRHRTLTRGVPEPGVQPDAVLHRQAPPQPSGLSSGRRRSGLPEGPLTVRLARAGSEFDSIGESITRYSSGASHLGLGDAEEEESEARLVGELIEEQVSAGLGARCRTRCPGLRSCLDGVPGGRLSDVGAGRSLPRTPAPRPLRAHRHGTLRPSLSVDVLEPVSCLDLGGSFRARTTSWDWSLEGEPEGSDRRSEPVAPSTDEAASHGSSGQSSPPTSPGGAARHYFKGFAKGAKAAAEKFMEK